MSISSTKRSLLESLKEQEFRQAFNLENVYTTICFQLRALREQRELSQRGLGQIIDPPMAQERISILEDPNAETKPTLSTLIRLADGLDVGLEVRFVPFSTVLDRSVRTDFKALRVRSFAEELPELERAVQCDDLSRPATAVASWEMSALGSIGNVITLPPITEKKPISSENVAFGGYDAALRGYVGAGAGLR